ncbi:MAG: hypothetical protein M1812_007371 [Candelaria pacifica]|nr:MAG: hypothetical protein M1812_007371 [Candelaria pacifica]
MAPEGSLVDNYKTPFYCALCGLPFARVFRTDDHHKDDQDRSGQCQQASSEQATPDEQNGILSREESEQLIGSDDCLELKLRERRYLEEYKVGRAYNGQNISGKQVEWIGSLRALLHRDAKAHPEGGRDNLEGDVYLTGRGMVAQDASWAYASPSIDTEIEEGDVEGGSLRHEAQYGFHVYEEPERDDRRFFYSSIPFHDQCWDILDLAVQLMQERKGISDIALGESIELKPLWSSLVSALPPMVPGKLSDLNTEALRQGRVNNAVTGLPCNVFVGPEVKQCAGRNGWLHIRGLEVGLYTNPKVLPTIDQFKWLVADPSTSLLLDQPFPLPTMVDTTKDEHSLASPLRNFQIEDPFFNFPPELVHEIMKLLSCREVFRWRRASVAIGQANIPSRDYRRFIDEEYAFLPQLRKRTLESTSASESGCLDWKQAFWCVSKACRRDESLRSRRRIWKAVLPIADELVETTPKNLKLNGCLDHETAHRTWVRRGYVGVMSGAEGYRHSLTFAAPSAEHLSILQGEEQLIAAFQSSSDEERLYKKKQRHYLRPSELVQTVREVVVWLDPILRNICGVEFCFVLKSKSPGPLHDYRKRIGTSSILRECYNSTLPHQALLGLVVCWYDACVQGLQLIFERTKPEVRNGHAPEALSKRFGSWEGPTRRLIVDPSVSRLAGFTAFISSDNRIETIALLEEVGTDAQYPLELSHQEASVWAALPPENVDMLERVGPFFSNWTITSADWHIFKTLASQYLPTNNDIGGSTSLGELRKIEGFWHDDYLIGLSFTYGYCERTSKTKLGACEGSAFDTLNLKESDKIVAVIVGHGSLGIHSVQIITTSASVTFGKRYLGEHTVHVRESVRFRSKERIGNFVYLMSEVIGFHCIYHSEVWQKRSLREVKLTSLASTILAIWVDLSAGKHSITANIEAESIALPFMEAEEHKNIWVDGSAPESYFPCFKKSESLMRLPTAPQGMFVGWISFDEPISLITIFGDMCGIKFTYSDVRLASRCFGNTDHGLEEHTQAFEFRGERITSIAVQHQNSGSTGDRPNERLKQIKFLTGNSTRKESLNPEVQSERLAGIQFFFTAACIVDWDPLLNIGAKDCSHRIAERIPDNMDIFWNPNRIPTSMPDLFDPTLMRKYRHLVGNFGLHEPTDGILGYITFNGRFCGLRFRRNKVWDKDSLGRASQRSMEFLLKSNEEIKSITVSKMKCADVVNAIAVLYLDIRSCRVLLTTFSSTLPLAELRRGWEAPLAYKHRGSFQAATK